MTEDMYTGRKFKTTFSSKEVPEDSRIYEMISLGEKFHGMHLLPKERGGHAGNMSFRNSKGFVITAGGIDKGKLTQDDFVQVLSCNVDTKSVRAEGAKEPSSETMMHYLIYSTRPEVGAIIHVHDDTLLSKAVKLKVKETSSPHPYGTVELAKDVVKSIGKADFVAVRKHGVVSLGKSLWEAGKRITTMHEAAMRA
jgi:L-fuculose-phosphate aldolase